MSLVLNSAIFSLVVQIIAGIFLVMSYFYKLHPDDMVLKSIVTLELIVQVIEGFFYLFLIKMFAKGEMDTSFRYRDWFFSTPVMLISTLLFLKWLDKKPVDIKETFEENKLNITGVVVFNALMLIIGFLGEKGIVSKTPVFILGTLFLIGSFGCLYKHAKNTKYGKIFLGIMFFIWSLYGFAFLLPTKAKNISYNILDLFSKNFYGVFLYIVIAAKYKRLL